MKQQIKAWREGEERTGKVSGLSAKKFGEISGLLKANRLSQYEVAGIVGMSRGSVKNIKKWYMDIVYKANVTEIAGEKHNSPTNRQKNQRYMPRNQKFSKRMLRKHIKESSIQVSQRTVQ
ncbi:hypothetical protein CEXT_25351 [Caerostris extrusa]|uniref:Uncharacterized protein n=1 Tax=Caerostris extrusa TaxID=172846 RepID=A0AAV4S4B7_CAEEX|nr:hypothetical protein CEXT_25351 [Caerostris extrusa]